MKEFNDIIGSIDKKLDKIQDKHKANGFLVDECGYTQVYVAATDGRYGIFWGPERKNMNHFSDSTKSSSAEAASDAIFQAHQFGITKLSVIMHRDIAVYPYIQHLSDWKKSGWKDKKQWIPHASNLKELDAMLMKYQDISVRFIGSGFRNTEHLGHLRSAQMLYWAYDKHI